MTHTADFALRFMNDVIAEALKAQRKFPQPNPCVAALTEEAGELARAILHRREKKPMNYSDIYGEAIQVAAMAFRIALEGDQTLGVDLEAESFRFCFPFAVPQPEAVQPEGE